MSADLKSEPYRYDEAGVIKVTGTIIDKRFIDIRTSIANTTARTLIDTQDKLIREGLERLGWKAPEQ